MAADILYTGKGLAAKLPTDGGNAMQGLSRFIAKAEETKFQVFQQNKNEFMKMTDVDPVMFLTTANQQAQAKLLDEFNKEASQIYKNSGGFPSMEDMQQIQAKKNYLISAQNDMQADMERYLQDREAVSKDFSGQIDQDVFKAREDAYISGKGKYGTEPLKPSSINPYAYYAQNRNKGTGTQGKVKVSVKKDGKVITEEREASATEDEAREMVLADMMSQPRLAMGYIEQFKRLKETDPETYVKYLDATGDGTVDPQEEKEAAYKSNPIIQWAQDNFWQNKITIKEKTEQKDAPKEKPKEGDLSAIVGKKRNIDPNYGNVPRPNIYSLGGEDALTDIPTRGALLMDDFKTYDDELSGNLAKGVLKDYDANRKTVIVQVTSRDPNSFIETKQLVEVPVENVIEQVKDIKLTVDGKTTTIGAMAGETTAPVAKKKFDPATGTFK